ncbi:MAG: hypothetical protein ABEH77_05815 [Halobacteriaceae archaeon]
MTDDGPTDEELAARVEELSEAVEQLRAEFATPPRGPLGLPRPPTPREVARFTADYTIPAAVASLEAAARALELLQAVLRAAEEGSRARGRAERAGEAVLDRLDDALAELQAAIEGSDLPPDPAARELLEEARRLSRETGESLADAEAAEEQSDDESSVDVEEELETIRREVEDGEDGQAT